MLPFNMFYNAESHCESIFKSLYAVNSRHIWEGFLQKKKKKTYKQERCLINDLMVHPEQRYIACTVYQLCKAFLHNLTIKIYSL